MTLYIAPDRPLVDEVRVAVMQGEETLQTSQATITVKGTPERPSAAQPALPRIQITQLPKADPGGSSTYADISGKVSGIADPQRYKVVLYAFTDTWYVQPLADSPYTSIDPDGTWNNWTHGGRRYAALLVKPSFVPSARVGVLPSGEDVLAVTDQAGAQ